jgi:hypothetical protein
MHESPVYLKMQKATIVRTLTGLDVFEPISLKVRHSSTLLTVPNPYKMIGTDPDEILDLFIVFHYSLE